MADMVVEPGLARARAAFAEGNWVVAHEAYRAARERGPMGPADLAAMAEAAWWRGLVEECLTVNEEAYRLHLAERPAGVRPAAMVALEIGFFWFLRGAAAVASGWFSRAQRLLTGEAECVEQGYLLSLGIEVASAEGDLERAVAVARQVVEVGERFGDDSLVALGLVGEGIATVRQGRVAQGMAVLDEAMLGVVAGRVQPAFAGNIYCQLMSTCYELADLRRAREWTEATAQWCEGFPAAVMFLGVCRVHRAQLLTVGGEWARAEAEARRVCEDLATLNVVAVSLAQYELGELARLRGDLEGAEAAYGRARDLGRPPQPGLALLELARGRPREALSLLRAAAAAATGGLERARLAAAEVEIALAAGDRPGAEQASEALDRAASRYATSGLVAAADQARGAVLVAGGHHEEGLSALAEAGRRWRDLGVPYRLAQVRVLAAAAHRARGQDPLARLELEAAADTFEELGARPDAERARAVASGSGRPGGLTAREVEVLALVATGATNRELARTLVLSEKTVARHLANIFVKLGVSSRTAAAAYAFEHGLISGPG